MSERQATRREFTGRPDRNPGEEHTMGYHVAQRVMRGEHKPSARGGQRGTPLRAALVLLLAGFLVIGSLAGAIAQSVPPGFTMGKVTAMRHQEIQVNLKNYRLHRTVKVQDDEGKLRELKDISKGSHVMFHLARGRVDQIILIVPQ